MTVANINNLDYRALVNAQLTRRAERSGIWSGRPVGFWEFDENYSLTEKGKNLWTDYNESPQEAILPTARKEFIEITGITKQTETDSLAEFTYRWRPNEFGKSLDPSTPEFKNTTCRTAKKPQEDKKFIRLDLRSRLGRGSKRHALFKRYDEGWRIVRVSFL